MTYQKTTPALMPVSASAESLLSLRIKHTRIKQVIDELNTLIYPGSQDSILAVQLLFCKSARGDLIRVR